MKNKFFWGILFTFCLSVVVFTNESFATEQTVKVTLPEFTVKLNGNVVNNQYREYPLLVYKNMTYLPMTWYDCRLLGLETKWNKEDGLKIIQSNVTSSYVPYKTELKNLKSYSATVPTFNSSVNGKVIDNSEEEYPLLSFNNITYFPLTWEFAHDEFGWEYIWDKTEGLTINSNNPQFKTVNLPEYATENDIAFFKEYYYFVETLGDTNKVYRIHEDNMSSKELVYSYELDTTYGFNNRIGFMIRDDELWFYYHIGGATMGSDIYCKINDNGKATVEHKGYLDFKNTPNGTLIIKQFVPPTGNNLVLESLDKDNRNKIGDSNLIYDWHINTKDQGIGYNSSNSTTVIGNDVYVLASPYPIGNEDLNRIYKVNLDTNETTKIIDFEVNDFKVINNKLYYIKSKDKSLYSSNLDGTNERKVSGNKIKNYISWYGEVDGNIYYTTGERSQVNLYKAEPSKEDILVLNEPLENVQIVNNKIICKLIEGEDYGVKVLDKSGNLKLAITDQVVDVFVYKDKIIMVSAEGKLIKLVN